MIYKVSFGEKSYYNCTKHSEICVYDRSALLLFFYSQKMQIYEKKYVTLFSENNLLF